MKTYIVDISFKIEANSKSDAITKVIENHPDIMELSIDENKPLGENYPTLRLTNIVRSAKGF